MLLRMYKCEYRQNSILKTLKFSFFFFIRMVCVQSENNNRNRINLE